MSGLRLTLVHVPSKARVTGEVPNGNYSRKQLIALKDALYQQLFIELEKQVAKVQRIPGQ